MSAFECMDYGLLGANALQSSIYHQSQQSAQQQAYGMSLDWRAAAMGQVQDAQIAALLNMAAQPRKPLSPDRQAFVDRVKRMMAILEGQLAEEENGHD